MRRISLLTAVAAAVAVGVLVVGGVVASGLTGRPAVAALMVVSAVAAGAGLAVGWRPALAVSSGMGALAGLLVVGQSRQWPALVVMGGAVAVSHEAARFSIDLRRPARLGPGVLRHLTLRTVGLVGAGAGTAIVAARLHGGGATWWVPVALVVAAAPVALVRLVSLNPTGPSRRRLPSALFRPGPGRRAVGQPHPAPGRPARLALAAVVSVAVLGTALLGAAVRQDIRSTPSTPGPISRAVTDDAAPEAGPAPTVVSEDDPPPRRSGRSLIDVLLLFLASAVVVLLVAGLRRNQIPLDTEPIDLGPDDPGLDLVAPGGAQLDEETVILADDVVADLVADIAVDLRSEPDPGRAVRYAYARVEQRLASLGIGRRPSESEPELLARALGVLGDESQALAELTGLFERARFSDSPVPEPMRAAAIDALDRLRARLEPVR